MVLPLSLPLVEQFAWQRHEGVWSWAGRDRRSAHAYRSLDELIAHDRSAVQVSQLYLKCRVWRILTMRGCRSNINAMCAYISALIRICMMCVRVLDTCALDASRATKRCGYALQK